MIKKYLYGTKVITDWKIGSAISFQGNWEGVKFKDKGIIKKFEIGKLFQYTYWSIFSDLPDKSENYSLITFELSGDNKETKLSVSQRGFANEALQLHSDKGWNLTLHKIKKLVED